MLPGLVWACVGTLSLRLIVFLACGVFANYVLARRSALLGTCMLVMTLMR